MSDTARDYSTVGEPDTAPANWPLNPYYDHREIREYEGHTLNDHERLAWANATMSGQLGTAYALFALVRQLAEARMWARHGYEIGQRSATWSDHGVAPAWLTEGSGRV